MALYTHLILGIKSAFADGIAKNDRISELLGIINSGTGTYVHAERYAEQVGKELSDALLQYITPESIPGGKITKEMANEILRPFLASGFQDVELVSEKVQDFLNKAAGIRLKAIGVKQNKNRVDGLCKAVSKVKDVETAQKILGEPITNYMMSVPHEVLKANANFQGKAGYKPQIVRKSTGKCCKFCDHLAGVYDYPGFGSDIFRRHQRCRCTVDYSPGDGRLQNVHSKQWR